MQNTTYYRLVARALGRVWLADSGIANLHYPLHYPLLRTPYANSLAATQLTPYELTHVRPSPGDYGAGWAQAARKI
jgi:hypothetical protein